MTKPQPSTEMFENTLMMVIEKIIRTREEIEDGPKKKPIWLEHEGHHIGSVSIPQSVQQWISFPQILGKLSSSIWTIRFASRV